MGNRKKNGKRSATNSSEHSSMTACDLAEKVEEKLIQAKAVVGLIMESVKGDEIVNEAAWAAESLIEDAQKAFKELRAMVPKESGFKAP